VIATIWVSMVAFSSMRIGGKSQSCLLTRQSLIVIAPARSREVQSRTLGICASISCGLTAIHINRAAIRSTLTFPFRATATPPLAKDSLPKAH